MRLLPLCSSLLLSLCLCLASAGTSAPQSAAPQFGSFGFDWAGMDRNVAPGDNFYAYANGGWAKSTAIPADKSNYGMFTMLADLSQQRLHEILEQARGDPASKIGAAYSAYLNTKAIELKGLAPIRPWLDEIARLESRAGYAALLAKAKADGVPVLFEHYVVQDEKAPQAYAFNLVQSGLGMPDRDYYLSSDARSAGVRAAYQKHLADLLTLAGEQDTDSRAAAIVAFETRIAEVSWTRLESRDGQKTYNRMSVADLSAQAPGFDFRSYFAGLGASVDSMVVWQPSAVTGIARLAGATPLKVLKDQLLVRSLDAFADVLPAAFREANSEFFGATLSGLPAPLPRWQRAIDFTKEALADDVSRLYVAHYFSPSTKAAAMTMVSSVIAAMDRRIDRLDWMSPATRAAAHRKLAAVHPLIGYPERWRDYSALTIADDDAFGNMRRANRWQHDYQIAKLGKPVERWEWGLTPMDVNAYANFATLEIVFPAAILQPPFFDPQADPAVNYGAIGTAIASQLARHVDDAGALYDASGSTSTWWTAADFAAYRGRRDALIDQVGAYEPLPGMHLNGSLTVNENADDVIGIAAAYDAYRVSLGGREAAVIGGFTGDQRFYLGWAQMWRRNYREANLRARLLTDPHSPAEQRTSIIRNFDSWYDAFDVKPGQKLYLPPEKRIHLW